MIEIRNRFPCCPRSMLVSCTRQHHSLLACGLIAVVGNCQTSGFISDAMVLVDSNFDSLMLSLSLRNWSLFRPAVGHLVRISCYDKCHPRVVLLLLKFSFVFLKFFSVRQAVISFRAECLDRWLRLFNISKYLHHRSWINGADVYSFTLANSCFLYSAGQRK